MCAGDVYAFIPFRADRKWNEKPLAATITLPGININRPGRLAGTTRRRYYILCDMTAAAADGKKGRVLFFIRITRVRVRSYLQGKKKNVHD